MATIDDTTTEVKKIIVNLAPIEITVPVDTPDNEITELLDRHYADYPTKWGSWKYAEEWRN